MKYTIGDKVIASGNRFNGSDLITGPGTVIRVDANNEPYYSVQHPEGERWHFTDELRPATPGYSINYEKTGHTTVSQGTTVENVIGGLLRIHAELGEGAKLISGDVSFSFRQ